jgi:hypothetical protein
MKSKEVSRFCSPEVEYLMISCRPHYLPPQTDAGTKTALNVLYVGIILLIPAYKQKHQEAPVTWSIRKWSDEADAKLQYCFASTDWNMFQDSSDGIEEYTTSVTGFINECIDDVVPTVTVHTYPNQKPRITGNICTERQGVEL